MKVREARDVGAALSGRAGVGPREQLRKKTWRRIIFDARLLPPLPGVHAAALPRAAEQLRD
jgi:hypothetical protein